MDPENHWLVEEHTLPGGHCQGANVDQPVNYKYAFKIMFAVFQSRNDVFLTFSAH